MKTKLLKKLRRRCSVDKIISCGNGDSWANAITNLRAARSGGFPYYEVSAFGESLYSKDYNLALEFIIDQLRIKYRPSVTNSVKVWYNNK